MGRQGILTSLVTSNITEGLIQSQVTLSFYAVDTQNIFERNHSFAFFTLNQNAMHESLKSK